MGKPQGFPGVLTPGVKEKVRKSCIRLLRDEHNDLIVNYATSFIFYDSKLVSNLGFGISDFFELGAGLVASKSITDQKKFTRQNLCRVTT